MFGTLVEDDERGMRFAVRAPRRVRGYGGSVSVNLGQLGPMGRDSDLGYYGDTPTVQDTGTGNTGNDILSAVGKGIGVLGTTIGAIFGQTPGTTTGSPPIAAPQATWVPIAGIALAGAALFLVLSKKKKG